MKENRLLSSRLKTVKINYKKCHDSHILCIWVMYSLWDRRWKYHTEKKNTVATNLIKEAGILCLTAYFGIFTACWYLGWAIVRESMFANPQEAWTKPSAASLPAEIAKRKENIIRIRWYQTIIIWKHCLVFHSSSSHTIMRLFMVFMFFF